MGETLQKCILIVDDEESVRMVCSRMLSRLGYTVEIAATATEAMIWVKKRSFDLVITDYRMPGDMNGITLGQAIRQYAPQTLLILMTAFPAVDMAVDTIRMGAHDYLIKPFDQAELMRRVNACFDKPAAA